jgi:sulfur carrier protein ThiS
MNIYSIKLITQGGKKTISVEDTKTVANILEENGVMYGGLQVNVNGQTLQASELNLPLNRFAVRDGSFISALGKQDNA